MIEFIFEESPVKVPRLCDVQNEQFFIDTDGYLCQKIDSYRYHTIATAAGEPLASHVIEAKPSKPIARVLPRVKKIKFPGVQ